MNALELQTTNVRFAGLGGSGVLKASDILADVAFRCGLTVKKAEVHGMSQRGGSVQSDVRFGPEIFSPMIPDETCDYLVVLDQSQIPVVFPCLRQGGRLLKPSALPLDHLPSPKTLNVAMLGLLSRHLDFPEQAWLESLDAYFPGKLLETNVKAFNLGRHS